MKSKRLRRLWICLPALLVCAADQFVTLAGQPDEYWAGDYLHAQEGAPHGLWLLRQHPLAFVGVAVAYMLSFSVAIVFLPRLLGQTLSVGLVLGHAWGTATWIFYRFQPQNAYWFVIALFVVCAVLIVGGIELSQRRFNESPTS